MKIQQHHGVVVDAAGSREGFTKRKRGGGGRGRAAPKERRSHVSWAAQTSTIYRGRGLRPPLGFPPQEEAASPRSHLGVAKRGERGGAHH